MIDDRRIVALAADGAARLQYIDASDTVAEMVRRHGLTGRAARLAAEAAVANLLLSTWTKGDERVQLQLQSSEPEVSFYGDVDAMGFFRGRLQPVEVPGEGLALHGAMLAIKSDGHREMYRGVTELRGEPVAEALQRHLSQSDQVRAVVRIDVSEEASRAQGIVIERLPTHDDRATLTPEAFDAAFAGLAGLTAEALDAEIEAHTLLGQPIQYLEDAPVAFRCRCSLERVEAMLRGLGPEHLLEMADEDHGAEVTCHFCNEVRQISEERLRVLRDEVLDA